MLRHTFELQKRGGLPNWHTQSRENNCHKQGLEKGKKSDMFEGSSFRDANGMTYNGDKVCCQFSGMNTKGCIREQKQPCPVSSLQWPKEGKSALAVSLISVPAVSNGHFIGLLTKSPTHH